MSDAPSRLRVRTAPPESIPDTDGGPARRSPKSTRPASASEAALAAATVRRERLREFQTGLSEKLRRAEATPLTVNRLGLQIGPHRLLVDLGDAGEIVGVPEIAPVPLTKAWYRGLANVRGSLIGIVDLSLFAGGPATPLDKESRVLVLSGELRFSAGLLVSKMLGLRSVADLSVVDAAAPRPETPFTPWTRALLADAQDAIWNELDLAALIDDPRFVEIGRG